jgi:hypothetical protein
MRFAVSVPSAALLLCATLFGQSTSAYSPAVAIQPQTFHIKGTITDPLEAVIRGVKVTFQSEQLSKTVTTNDVGVYEADLPFGNYTMTAQSSGFRVYGRPLFRVTVPINPILNATLLVGDPCGDMIVVNRSGEPVTDEQWKAAREHCRREELIPIPSEGGVPFQLSIRSGTRSPIGNTNSYSGEKTSQYEVPVFVAYNLFSLRADKVIYDAKKRTIDASGNVVVVNESGSTQRSDSMAFRIKDSQVVLFR